MGGLRLGRLFGIPIQINFSFLLLMLIYLVWHGIAGVGWLVVVFLSVLVHELGHALVARRLRVPILGIDLHFFGGAAKMGRMPTSPREEILIAAAGPAVSLAVALVALLLHLATQIGPIAYLAAINLVLGLFNLLPALPMDGGRILRALLARRLGRLRATTIAVRVAKGIAVVLAIVGIVRGNFFLVGLALLLWVLAGAELRMARLWGTLHQGSGGVLASDGEVEVLERGQRPAGPGLVVEEQRVGSVRRWIIRAPDGRIIFTAEEPLRW